MKVHIIFISAGIIFAASVFVIVTSVYKEQTKPVIESKKTEMKQIPADVRKKAHIASFSAELRVPILMYHYVEYVKDKRDTYRMRLDIVPAIFEEQIKTLKDEGYTFLSMKDLADCMDGKKDLPRKPVVITLDDGHWDVYTDILPILQKYHAKATAYVISGFIDGSDFLSLSQLEAVAKSGYIEVGAHTVHHVSLKGKLQPIVSMEISKSKQMLEDMIHMPVVSFAYPNGAFDEQAVEAVRAAGFRTAVSTIPGITASSERRYFLYRLRPGNRTGAELITFLSTVKDPVR